MKTLYLCGAGNSEGVRLALTINQQESHWDRIFLLDDDVAKQGQSILGVEIIGPFATLERADPDSAEVANLVARTTARRRSARRKIEGYGLSFASLIHPGVDVFGAELARDVVVYQNATIGPRVSIDDACVVFMGAVVGHGCRLGQCCVIGANAVLNARVELGDGVYVGTNATALPEMRIGPLATIGAGSVAIQDVPPGATVMGVPARILVASDAEPYRDSYYASGQRIADREKADTDDDAVDTELERSIADIWKEVLNLPKVCMQERFFAVGGDSLLALQVLEKIQRAVHRELSPTDIFRFPTVRSLANHISRQGNAQFFTRREDIRRELAKRRRERVPG